MRKVCKLSISMSSENLSFSKTRCMLDFRFIVTKLKYVYFMYTICIIYVYFSIFSYLQHQPVFRNYWRVLVLVSAYFFIYIFIYFWASNWLKPKFNFVWLFWIMFCILQNNADQNSEAAACIISQNLFFISETCHFNLISFLS